MVFSGAVSQSPRWAPIRRPRRPTHQPVGGPAWRAGGSPAPSPAPGWRRSVPASGPGARHSSIPGAAYRTGCRRGTVAVVKPRREPGAGARLRDWGPAEPLRGVSEGRDRTGARPRSQPGPRSPRREDARAVIGPRPSPPGGPWPGGGNRRWAGRRGGRDRGPGRTGGPWPPPAGAGPPLPVPDAVAMRWPARRAGGGTGPAAAGAPAPAAGGKGVAGAAGAGGGVPDRVRERVVDGSGGSSRGRQGLTGRGSAPAAPARAAPSAGRALAPRLRRASGRRRSATVPLRGRVVDGGDASAGRAGLGRRAAARRTRRQVTLRPGTSVPDRPPPGARCGRRPGAHGQKPWSEPDRDEIIGRRGWATP